jgi:hypothetical protein
MQVDEPHRHLPVACSQVSKRLQPAARQSIEGAHTFVNGWHCSLDAHT